MRVRHTERVHPVFLYRPGDRLSEAELCAARLDGDVIDIDDMFVPADLVDSPALRAAVLVAHRQGRERLAFTGASAAWVHGAGDRPPHRHEVQPVGDRRVRMPPSPRLLLHDLRLDPGDTVLIGGALVATPVRTLLDLVRGITRHPGNAVWARALLSVRPDILDETADRLDAYRRTPGHRQARAVLDDALRETSAARVPQDDVTR